MPTASLASHRERAAAAACAGAYLGWARAGKLRKRRNWVPNDEYGVDSGAPVMDGGKPMLATTSIMDPAAQNRQLGSC